ncbi:uncharacterized protein LOC123678760 isoform X2 [Harmonia axyridis]|uniref:uncharacterized protein LOC123678760 isoform X2 n=1 Tax=Harmonia axyridis TaxID=115357 RepID=UPI001E279BE4|nr:uncharacterized protein LOC123678760 isoform X2 [Harmonia axyridis]
MCGMIRTIIVFCCAVVLVKCQVDLRRHFRYCRKNNTNFDNCVKDGINNLRPYYKSGLPDYGIASLDPFYAEEVTQKRSNFLFNYKLVLRNVTEAGWSVSEMTKFRSDFKNNLIQYTQTFPDKQLKGWYEIEGNFMGTKLSNKGSWSLGLYDFVQTTTITRTPMKDHRGKYDHHPPLKVNVNIQNSKKLELHIGHLAGGRRIVENMLDWIINSAWQPGFVVLSPLINDLVSTAFTKIMNDSFKNFPLEQIFPY